MQATDLGDGDDLSDLAWHDWWRDGAILVGRRMRAGALVIVDIRRQDAAQMSLVEGYDVVQKLVANRVYDPLDIGVLSGRSWRHDDLRDPHRLDPVEEV
jgi:hypothetical protein